MIVGCALLGGVAGVGAGHVIHPSQTATEQVLLARPLGSQLIGTSSGANDASRASNNEVQILQGDSVLAAAEKAAGHTITSTVTAVDSSDVATIAASASSSTQAVADAEAVTKAYITLRSAQLAAQVTAAENAVKDSLNSVTSQLKPLEAQLASLAKADSSTRSLVLAVVAPQRDALLSRQTQLLQQLSDLTVRDAAASASPRVIADAQVPTSSPTKQKVLDIGGGVLVGALLGAWLAFVVERRRGRVIDDEDVRTAGLSVPVFRAGRRQWDGTLVRDLASPASGVFAALASHATAAHSARVVTVSPVDDTHSSGAAAAGVAVATAALGRRVALVECDRMAPALPGLFSRAVHTERPTEHLTDAACAHGFAVVSLTRGAADASWFTAPSQDLTSVVTGLLNDYDAVVLSTPGVANGAVAVVAAAASDAVILTASNRTIQPALRKSFETVSASGTPVVGLFVAAHQPKRHQAAAAVPASDPARPAATIVPSGVDR